MTSTCAASIGVAAARYEFHMLAREFHVTSMLG
jgi:hypothetical protein